ncbi:MAG: response regulator, partial [Desulfobulbaceae bacterium]|nr:response regulator [Desulfobulbaceae bacterium]
HITKTPVVDNKGNCAGLLCSLHDITARKQSEEILENNEARFRGLFDNMNSGAAIFKAVNNGEHFVVIDFNKAAERIEKLDKEKIIGKNISEIFPNIQQSGLEDILRKVWQTGDAVHNQPTFYQDERISGWREYHVYKLPSGELVSLFDDVTQRKQVEEELRQAQKLEAIGTLAGGIAHDFNNILTAIIGYTQLLLYDTSAEEKSHPLLTEVLNASKRATNLVNQILTFSRQTEKERKPIEAQPVVKEALKLLRGTLPSTIEIVQEIDTKCRMIMADPVQIHQILMNLCTNAYHAMRKNGGTLTVSMKETTIEPGFTDAQEQELSPGSYICLSIRDSGEGMSEETLAKIFAPYFSTKGPGEGTGLGLSTVLSLTKSYNGGITAESSLGEGSTFSVYLPILIEEEAEDTDKKQLPMPLHISARILFVDDEETIVRLCKITLERLGCEVTALNSGIDALVLFKQDPQRFDLVITDQTMPGLTGAALSRQILAIRPELPIIMATGYSETIDEEQAKEIGIRELLMKPLDLNDLEQVIIRNLPENVSNTDL